jgi:segregation and condensation protein B
MILLSKNKVEALLFVSKEPLSPERISKVLDIDESAIQRWLGELLDDYKQRGITLRRIAGAFEFAVSPDYYEAIEPVVQKSYQQLSKPCIETAAVVGLFQPIIKAKIASFRDVQNADAGIFPLIELGIIKDTPKGFITTDKFLKFFGVNDLEELKEKLNLDNFSKQ